MKRYSFLLLMTLLFFCNDLFSQDTLIYRNAHWKYFSADSIPEYYWMVNNFPDHDWIESPAPFGYGDIGMKTVLYSDDDQREKRITEYFRKSFYVEKPGDYFVYLLKVLRDDGAVIYVNGREVWRTNMPDGVIVDSTFALTTISVEQEVTFYDFVLSPDFFREGMNSICVSVHQSRPSSSDCSFDLELIRHNDLFSLNQHLRTQNTSEQFFNKSFSLLSVQFELENKNNEIRHLLMKNDNLRNYAFLIAFIVLILLGVLFMMTIRGLKKSNKLEIRNQNTSNQLSQKNKEIINYALNIVQHKHFLKSIKEELNLFSKKVPKDELMALDRIITKLSFYDDHEEEWERLKVHFDSVHSGFFSKLKNKCPQLTQTELEHCSFIKLQLPTKEIARMLNIDPKSVQASRYRIKKKMNLPQEVDLREIIENF